MPELFIYLIRVSCCSAILFIYYLLILRNQPFHSFNRWYLLGSVLVSLVLPLVSIPIGADMGGQLTGYVQTLQAVAITPSQMEIPRSFGVFLLPVYGMVSIVLLLALIFSVWNILHVRIVSSRKKGNIRIAETQAHELPFTFLRTIFWNAGAVSHTRQAHDIFRHEECHARCLHTADILFIRIAICVAWINPFFYLIAAELRTVHEFLADDYAANEGDPFSYAELLVHKAIDRTGQTNLVHHFYFSSFKRRIFMLTQNTGSRKFSALRKVMMIPLVIILFSSFMLTTADAGPVGSGKYPVSVSGDEDASFPGGQQAWAEYLFKTLHYPQVAQDKEIQGTVVVSFHVDKLGNVSDVVIASGTDKGGLQEEAVRVIKASGKWIPAKRDGVAIDSEKKQPIEFRLERQ